MRAGTFRASLVAASQEQSIADTDRAPAGTRLKTARTSLRPVALSDVEALAAILSEPSVAEWWPRFDAQRVRRELIDDPDDATTAFVVEAADAIIGLVQFYEEVDPDYRHAGMDIFLSASSQGQGIGTEVLRRLIQYLFDVRGHHRLVIDPSATNRRAIRTYAGLGFRRVGIMRSYERGPDGTWRNGLLMDLLREDWEATDG